MEYYSGLDVSLRSVAICILDAKGKTVLERAVPCEIDDIAVCFRGINKPISLVCVCDHVLSKGHLINACVPLSKQIPTSRTRYCLSWTCGRRFTPRFAS